MPEENVVSLSEDPRAESSRPAARRLIAARRLTPNEAPPRANHGGFQIGEIRPEPLIAPIGNIFFLDYTYGVDIAHSILYDEKEPRSEPKSALERVAGPDFL